jgi:cephalosporin hydroxylase
MRDDRAEFEAEKLRKGAALAGDRETFNEATTLLYRLDKYDYAYLWSWLGVPIIQLPADIIATQEAVWSARPTVVVECGVARGGSLIFLASLLQLLGRGKVIGIDIDIRPHNRDTITSHPLAHRIELIEGASTHESTIAAARLAIPNDARVMVILDSDHSRDHVLAELRAYGPLVTKGQYLVVADTLLGHIDESMANPRRSNRWYRGNDPLTALQAYLQETDRFASDNTINNKLVLSSSPGGFLRCVKD